MDRTLEIEVGPLPAGTLVPAGRYRRIDVPWGRMVSLDREDHLPASLDGHVALYEPVTFLFSRAQSAAELTA